MERMIRFLAARSDEDLLKDWKILDQPMRATEEVRMVRGLYLDEMVRGLYLDEMEKRWPRAFDYWLASFDNEKGIEDFMKYEDPNYEDQ